MKLKNIFLCGLAALALTGCNLDEFPKDSVSPETFFKTEKELKLYSNQFYTSLPEASDFYKESSDYIVHSLSYSDAVRGYAHVVPSTGGGWNFSMLRHINYFLQNLYRCDDAAVRAKYEGVGRFWRAYFYFSKLQLFGDLPWYDQVLNSDDDELLYKRSEEHTV